MIKTLTMHNNDTTPRHIGVGPTHWVPRFDSCTTPIQQLYNNPSHEGGPQYVGPTLMWGIVVQLLYWCCKSNIFPNQITLRNHIFIIIYKRNDCCTTHVQLQQFFFKLTIWSIFLHVGPTYPMVDFKKKCWNYTRVV
jgi:hypothetical protein